LNDIQRKNLRVLAAKISELEEIYGQPFIVTSGFRSVEDQERINPSVKNSAHMSGEAVDISDPDSDIWGFLIDHLDEVVRLGLYLESKVYTRRWVHLQTRKPRSGNRIFIP
jgi:hypothetical protein